jgi:hypothetical protein
MNPLNNLAGIYGSRPIDTSTTDITFDAPAHGVEVWEDTTFGKFYNEKDEAVSTGWEGVTITVTSGAKQIFFGRPITRMTIASGGYGQYFMSKPV